MNKIELNQQEITFLLELLRFMYNDGYIHPGPSEDMFDTMCKKLEESL